MLQPGDQVPDLTGAIVDGATLALADRRGEPVVVYFYPRDNTIGCTREAQDFRDLYPAFRAHGCEVIGVSRDTLASHAKFRERNALPFPLVADTDEAWCQAFGVLGEKVLYGRRSIGIVRSTFLIDGGGILVHAWRKVKVPGHAAAVLERLAAA
ncbi:MAG: peroxiredoxin [Xanthomonadales bacterium]|nr:peroxiredoxin [Xanthomonadales bacterium]